MNPYVYVLCFSLATSTLFGNPDFQNQDDFVQRNFDERLQNEYYTRPYLDDSINTRANREQEAIYSQPTAADDSLSKSLDSSYSSVANDGAPYCLQEQNTALSYRADSQCNANCSACGEYNSCCDSCNDWDIWLYPNYLYVGYTGGDGIGYRRGYGTLGIFLTPGFFRTSCLVPFLDVKGYAFEDRKWGGSVGVGTRWILPSRNMILGWNIYYDYRKFHRFNLNQIGVGLEVLGPCWDLRVNGYIPTKTHFNETRLFDFSESSYGGSSSYGSGGFFAIRNRRISAWYGVDGEIGTWIKRKYTCDFWGLYVAAGPYYYFREHQHRGCFNDDGRRRDAFGGRIRLLARIWDVLDLSVIATYDPKWHTRVQGQIILTIPFDGGKVFKQSCNCCSCECRPCLLEQIAEQPVQRNGIIAADRGKCCWLWNWSDEGADSYGNRPSGHSISLSRFESLCESSSSGYSSFSSFSPSSSSSFHH